MSRRGWSRNEVARAAAAALAGIALVLGAGVADAQRRRPPPPAPPSVIVDVDALGLIEAWWRHDGGTGGRSSARLSQPATTLLFHCGPGDALYVWIDAAPGQAPPGAGAANSFGCAPGEGLFAIANGAIACASPAAAPPPFAPPPSSVIAIGDGTGTHTLTGECIGPTGSVAPAYIGADIAGGTPGPAGAPCPGTGSSVQFRGQVTARGC